MYAYIRTFYSNEDVTVKIYIEIPPLHILLSDNVQFFV